MAIPVLKVGIRKRKEKNQLKSLRKEGLVPAILYSCGEKTISIKLSKLELEKILNRYGVGSTIQLDFGKEIKSAIIKEIQRHITKDYVLHMDLQELDENKEIRVRIPLYILNKSVVESSVSVIQQQKIEIEIQTYPRYLPQSIEFDATNMKFGEPILVKDLNVFENENIEVLDDGESIVALLASTSKVEDPVEEPSLY
ncbi:MAG: 50S ribosomal protein L25 [Anaeromicrobium sp.]|jgi:large subunit ribosomal protein L25|uniref:50S ribosomal protein L25 n=1 Tax=Anaeromicrobium sp. TaxID=1929132 RepID=UPI0025EBBF4E|nr:50S ribosomal protein L25 [Anaeromicrobium sp.]MCT4593620.1 50S ribosomal protein L25 [Anaeromicrobium sp.]